MPSLSHTPVLLPAAAAAWAEGPGLPVCLHVPLRAEGNERWEPQQSSGARGAGRWPQPQPGTAPSLPCAFLRDACPARGKVSRRQAKEIRIRAKANSSQALCFPCLRFGLRELTLSAAGAQAASPGKGVQRFPVPAPALPLLLLLPRAAGMGALRVQAGVTFLCESLPSEELFQRAGGCALLCRAVQLSRGAEQQARAWCVPSLQCCKARRAPSAPTTPVTAPGRTWWSPERVPNPFLQTAQGHLLPCKHIMPAGGCVWKCCFSKERLQRREMARSCSPAVHSTSSWEGLKKHS